WLKSTCAAKRIGVAIGSLRGHDGTPSSLPAVTLHRARRRSSSASVLVRIQLQQDSTSDANLPRGITAYSTCRTSLGHHRAAQSSTNSSCLAVAAEDAPPVRAQIQNGPYTHNL